MLSSADALFESPSRRLPPRLQPALLSRNPVAWLVVFGPGAVIASLTIGTGELVFSSRAGAIFGYEVLWLFALSCALKWVLVFTAARHMVVSGSHAFERWARLPGPRGWLPLVFLVLALPAFPVWTGFVGGVLGTLAESYLGSDSHFWGVLAVAACLVLLRTGGYATLERVQLVIVAALLASVTLSLILLHPDWGAWLRGLLLPGRLEYPPWLSETDPQLASRPVWVEAATYVGVIGGSGYDYLAYVSFLRHKSWGLSGSGAATRRQLQSLSPDVRVRLRHWIRAPLVDCTASFAVVLLFSAVFVASGAVVLGPLQQIPDGSDLLNLQAAFVTQLHPWLLPLYLAGATLAMLGTLYGTLAVAPGVIGEIVGAVRSAPLTRLSKGLPNWPLFWSGLGGIGVLAWSSLYTAYGGGRGEPPQLIEIVTPANLFTGVLACGIICLLNGWMDLRFLPRRLRAPVPLLLLNLVAAGFFLLLGVRGYWDFAAQRFQAWGGGWLGIPVLAVTLTAGWLVARLLERSGEAGGSRSHG